MGARRATLRDSLDARLGRTLNEVLLMLLPDELAGFDRQVKELSRQASLLYEDSQRQLQPIPVLLRPRILSREQCRYFQRVCLHINDALERLYLLWSTVAEVRALLPLTPGEERWLASMPKTAPRSPQTIFGRLDVQVDFSDPDWERT